VIDGLGVGVLSKMVYFVLFLVVGFIGIMIFSRMSSCFKGVCCVTSCLKIFRKNDFQEFKDEEETQKIQQTTNP